MKNLLFVVLLFVSVNLSAEVNARFETGGAMQNGEERLAFTLMEMGYSFNIFQLKNEFYGGYLTWFKVNDENQLHNKPFRDIYTFGYKMKYDIFYVRFQHFCNHPVYNGGGQEWYSNKWGENITSYSFGVEIIFK